MSAVSTTVVREGLVVSAWSGWYRVQTEAGPLLCRPRGRLRPRSVAWRQLRDAERWQDAADFEETAVDPVEAPAVDEPRPSGLRPEDAVVPGGSAAVLAGDRVRCLDLGDGEGRIEEVLPRRNVLQRPPVANVDQVLIVASWDQPPFSAELVDRLLVALQREGCVPILCVNKVDLVPAGQRAEIVEAVAPYRRAGFAAVLVSALTGEGLADLGPLLPSRVTVLAGPSGAGKSALLARLCPEHAPVSGEVSVRLGRGRHTTRHVQLLAVSVDGVQGWVADTPGFSRLDLTGVRPEELGAFYPEFAEPANRCRFRGCLHESEPGCAVAEAAERGELHAARLQRYRALLAELRARPQWR